MTHNNVNSDLQQSANQSAPVHILKLLLDANEDVVLEGEFYLVPSAVLEAITPRYRAVIEELQSIGFPIVVWPSELTNGRVVDFFGIDWDGVEESRGQA